MSNAKIRLSVITAEDIHRVIPVNREKAIEMLRDLRESECFSVYNRGYGWFQRLTEEQRLSLEKWYQEWLDVTKTFAIPKKPVWLK